ncbi:MAG: LamG-like jellyroll fold domain-containing protein, partial [Verrucomicrobiota bacterium]
VTLANLPTGSLCDGQWHHIAITVPQFLTPDNVDYARFYFDGTEAALTARGAETISVSATSFSEFDDNGLRIGCDGSTTPAGFFNGALDEIAFFPRVLTPAEVTSLATARPPTAPPSYTSDTGNPSGDGVPNLMKYALGLNPNLALTNSSGLPTFSANGTTLGYAFTRVKDASDITYQVERSFDLSSWSEIWSSATDPYIGTDPTTTELIESENIWPKVFFRLRITKP